MIKRSLFSIWLNDDPILPPLIQRCIDSQKAVEGYEHKLYKLPPQTQFPFPGAPSMYFVEAKEAKKWVKLSDYMRMLILHQQGGIYLDADVELLPGKNFNDLLDCPMFVGQEKNGIFSNAVVGAEAGHPLLKEYLRRIEDNFRGDGDLVFEPGIRAFADLLWLQNDLSKGVKILPPDYFYPMDQETRTLTITPNSRTIHYFNNSWL